MLNNLNKDLLREVCKYLNVNGCVNVEQVIFKSIPENYRLYDIVDYVERKKYEPYKKTVDLVSFHSSYKKSISSFHIVVKSQHGIKIEEYYLSNQVDSKQAYLHAFHMFTRAPGYWYQNNLLTASDA
ncbi:MAG: hypothetical protein CMF41_06720 [Legionellales bacterium]|nr:hypothetical protein [Legionellales bacterium]|tara:strand:+ start:980 stop:1360 length:381 start_codon:yes stop_codon:yes gene_type:complete